MKKLSLFLLACLAGPAVHVAAQDTAPKAAQRAPAVFRPVADAPGLPRVLLIGDSISMGYTEPVRQLLEGKFNVHRIPENGGPTSRGAEKIEKWLGDGRWDVIHVNFGLHDLRVMETGKHQVPIADYEANLRQLAAKLKATGARVIWASTTPVPEGKLSPPRSPADVIAYNAAARRVMEESGIAINDLYAFVLPRMAEIQLPANVHFTKPGYAALAQLVADAIAKK